MADPLATIATSTVTKDIDIKASKGAKGSINLPLVLSVSALVVIAGATVGIYFATRKVATTTDPCIGIDTTSPVTINLEPEWGDYSTCSGSTGSSCTGMIPSLVTAVCAAGGLTCTQSVTPWSSVWDGAIGAGFNDGSVQVAAGARFTVPRSDQCMAFSNPYTAASTGSVLATAAIGETPPASGTAVTFCSLKGWAIGTNYLNEAKGKQTEWNGGSRGVFSMNYIITVVEKETFADILTAHNNSDCHYSLVEPGGIAGGSLITVETVTEAHHRVGGVSFMADGAASNTKCIISKLNAGLGAVRRSGVLAGLAVGKTVDAVELTALTTNSNTCTRAGPCDDVDTTSPVTINLEPEWGDYSTCSGSTGSSCTGMVPSLVTAVCAAGGLTCNQSVTPWSSVWDGAIGAGFSDGTVQVAAGARFTVPRSDQCMAFSNPYTAASTGSVLATAAIGETPPASGTAVTFCSLKGWAIGTNYLNEAKGKQTEWNGGSRGVFSMNYIITVVEKETFADILTAHNNSDCHYSLVEPGGIAGGSLITVETVTEAHHRVGGVSFMADGAASNTKCIISKLNAGLGAVRRSGVLAGLAVGKTVDAVELTAHTGRYDETCTRG